MALVARACESCGAPLGAGALTCTFCGMSHTVAAEALPIVASSATPGLACLACKRAVREQDRFCDCGAPLVMPCPACEKDVRRGRTVCNECGVPLEAYEALTRGVAAANAALKRGDFAVARATLAPLLALASDAIHPEMRKGHVSARGVLDGVTAAERSVRRDLAVAGIAAVLILVAFIGLSVRSSEGLSGRDAEATSKQAHDEETQRLAEAEARLDRADKARRQAEANAHRPPEIVPGRGDGEYVHVPTGITLLWCPPGTFRMGCADGDPQQGGFEARITRGYFFGKYEVTWGQYRAFCEATRRPIPPSSIEMPTGRFEAESTHPVFGVSWDDATAYCEWARLRLPTEAEWELAARGTTGQTYPWGNTMTGWGNMARGDHRYTAPIGSYPRGASPVGALDMAGNVWEWVADWHGPYPSTTLPLADPSGPPTGTRRVYRGGSWCDEPVHCRASHRYLGLPSERATYVGFRVAASATYR